MENSLENRVTRLEKHLNMLEGNLFRVRPLTDRCRECQKNNIPLFSCRRCDALLCVEHIVRCWYCCEFLCEKHSYITFKDLDLFKEVEGKLGSCVVHNPKTLNARSFLSFQGIDLN